MADRNLSIHQQIALLPAAIPDAILDFLEDFAFGTPLQAENSRNALDPEYLKTHGETLRSELEKLRQEAGKLLVLHVDQGGREIPGAFLLKLTFEKGVRGVGVLTKIKERTILRVLVQPGEYSDADLKNLVRNPPIQG